MKLSSWNVNSFKMRTDHIAQFLDIHTPDILGLQELKAETIDENAFRDKGYTIHYVGQKAYNGVALLTRLPLTILSTKLSGDDTDTQARFIEGEIDGTRIINIYLPNGNPVGTEKFDYKLSWMSRLLTYLTHLRRARIPFVVMGDFNIIPEDIDCYDPKVWQEDALFHPQSRSLYRALINLGLVDCFRNLHATESHAYTFWDYQAGAWPRNNGIRIDHILASPTMADRLLSCVIDKTPRGWDKASDHTPILAEFNL
jgi:exodeoxyribonuclease III